MKLIEKNISNILALIDDNKQYSIRHTDNNSSSLYEIYEKCKEQQLIASSMNLQGFVEYLVGNKYLFFTTITIGRRQYTRYRRKEAFDIFDFLGSFEPNGFFSMSTALNLQGFCSYRTDLIFYSNEQKTKLQEPNLSQEAINIAFKKSYRITSNIAEFEDKHIILLQPKNTNNFEIINHRDYRVSSINRAFVEMLVNIQFFKNIETFMDIFKPIKNELSINTISEILEHIDYIYPYNQSIGFILEKIGFHKKELSIFKNSKAQYRFYIEKGKENYAFDNFWNIYY